MRNELEIIRKLTSSSSPWFKKIKTDKIWLCESVGKIKGIGKQGEVKMNEINVYDLFQPKTGCSLSFSGM